MPLNGLTTPDILHWTFSGEIVFFTVLGGFGTFAGPIVGAIVFNYLKTFAVGYTVYWQMFLGVVLVTLVLALPTGIMGMVGRLAPEAAEGARGMSLLQTAQLTKYFGDTHAVDHVDFSVREGEVLALIGSNGAGKTTLVNVISGLIVPDSGSIRFLDADITRASIHEKIAAGIARSFQLVNLFDKLSTIDNVALSIFSRQGKTRRLFTLADADAGGEERGLGHSRAVRAPAQGGHARGRPVPGRAQASRRGGRLRASPKLLFLDEPTSGVSTREKAPIMDIITQVVRSERITAVIIEHDMDVVFTYCPRIVAMHQGAILADGTPEEIRSNEQVTANMLGTDRHA